MSRYQVLEAPLFLKRTVHNQRRIKEEKLVQIQPVFYRNGWYCNRHEKRSWYEYDNTAWEADYDQFRYYLNQENKRVLSKPELKAIDTLFTYGPYPKELKKLLAQMLADHADLMRLQKVHIFALKVRRNMKKKRSN